MSRTGALAILASIVCASVGVAVEAPSEPRPNILWFIADDPSPYMGAYGDPVARTPTIDQLAAEGIRYDTAYSDAPVCAPSRFALITGLYSATAGPAHHMRATAELPAFIRGWPELLRQAGYYTVNRFKTDYNANIDVEATWDDSSPQAHWRNRPEGAPFFAQITTLGTHELTIFSTATGATSPDEVSIPPFYPDTPTTRADKARYYDRIADMDAAFAQVLSELDDDGLTKDTIVFFFSDNGGVLPWSKRFANDRGLRVPLIVRIPAKWSHLAGARPGSVVEAPVEFVDFAPTVLALAGVRTPGYMQGKPFLGRARREKRYAFGQRSRMDERYDLQRAVRDERYLYVRNYMPHRPYGQHVAFMWNQRGYQEWERRHLDGELTPLQERFWGEKPSEELYDVREDSDQLTNLAGEPRLRKVRRRLRKALDKHMIAIRDNGFIPEGSPVEGYEESRVRRAYPIRRVMRLARQASERDPRNLRTFVKASHHANEIVRYWATQGLLILASGGQPAVTALTGLLADDPSVHVRVVAAEGLARMGNLGAPVAFLAETLDTHDDVRVRLAALNALTYVPTTALVPYGDAIDRAAGSSDADLANAGRYVRAVVNGTYDPLLPP